MSDHLELIQRAVETRRKFCDVPAESQAEEAHWKELRQLIREAESHSSDAAAELHNACRLDYLEQLQGMED